MKKVWVNGSFDMLHYGHLRLIDYASKIGSYLVIGIDTDERIKSLKGNHRPYHTEEERIFNLFSIKGVNKVVIFNTDDELIWHIQNEKPDVMVIGSDYIDKPIIGREFIPSIRFFDRLDYSTTEMLNNL
jgi:D-beta-D-heptose 7-phosphate kinase/D-beta-D-heptose 1-phosphate adenosyltransferase